MKNTQLNTIYDYDQDNSVSPFFSEESYFLHRMSELWGEELWEEVDLEESEPVSTKVQHSSVPFGYATV